MGDKRASINKQSISKFEEIKKRFGGVSSAKVIDYLLSLEDSAFEKGTAKVERKIKEWLHLGYEGVITAKGLRHAQYRDGKSIAVVSIEQVMEEYKEEIEAHNKKISSNQ